MSNLKNMNNVELMEYILTIGGKTGALKVMVVFNELRNGVKEVVDNKEELLREQKEQEADGKISIISNSAYIAACEEILGYLDEANR